MVLGHERGDGVYSEAESGVLWDLGSEIEMGWGEGEWSYQRPVLEDKKRDRGGRVVEIGREGERRGTRERGREWKEMR
jgi:hypothetical protein